MKRRGDPCHKGAWPRKRAAPQQQALRYGTGHAWDFGMVTGGKIGTTGKAGQRAARKARLAAALRQNLKRRKQQARELAQKTLPSGASAGAASSQHVETDDEAAGGGPDFRRNRDEE